VAVKNKAGTRQVSGQTKQTIADIQGALSAKPARRAEPRRRASPSYLMLARAYPLHPIRSNTDLDEAIAILDGLLSRRKPLDEQERDYRDCLGHEIERYEAEAYPMADVFGADMLRHLIDARGASLSEVAKGTGISLSTLSAILNKKGRKLNLKHVMVLAPYFGTAPGAFLERTLSSVKN
jgi:antitoxin component HigA of HigAB toxin-antitoxin module